MKFYQRKKRQTPAVILISLIDVLLVLLIFLMVTSTFEKIPSVRITLPESSSGVESVDGKPPALVTVATNAPFFFLDDQPLELEALKTNLMERQAASEDFQIALRADQDAAFGKVLQILDLAKSLDLKVLPARIRAASGDTQGQ